MPTLEIIINDLEEKLKTAKAKKQKLDARKRKAESKTKRAADTRKKILVGASVLAAVERGEWSRDKLHSALNAALVRADDRALFDLPAQTAAQASALVG